MPQTEEKIVKLIDGETPTVQATVEQRSTKGVQLVGLVDSDGNDVTELDEATDYNGGPVTVGTSAVEMTFTGATKSLFVQSDHDNTGTIWIGGATIDNTGANAVARLDAGEALTIDFDDSSNAWYAVSDTASQKVYKLALT